MSAGTLTPSPRRPPVLASVRAAATPATLTLTALIVLAALLRFYRIGHQAFWFDEGNTVLLIHMPAGKMLGLIPQTESTPPLYYCIAWIWARIFGYGEAGVRSLSAAAGVLSVPVVFAAARKLVSERAGVIAAALVACNPFLIWYSQEARAYQLLVLFGALSLLAFAHLRVEPTPRAAGAWTVASLLSLLTHYYAIVAIVPQALWLLYEHRRRRPVQAAIGLTALGGAALIPLLLSQNSTGRDSWIANSSLALRLRQIVPQFLIGPGAPARDVLKFVALALALAAIALLAVRARADERRPGLMVWGLALSGFVLAFAFIAVGSDTLITRNVIVLLAPAAIGVSAGLAVYRARWLGAVIASGLCAIGVIAAISVAVDYPLQRPDWRAVAAALGPRPVVGSERAILIQHYRTLLPLSLYLTHLSFAGARPLTGVEELDVIAIGGPEPGKFCWWGSACNLVPSQLQGSYPIPGFRELWVRKAQQFTIMRLVSSTPQTLTASEVASALTTTRLRRDGLLRQS